MTRFVSEEAITIIWAQVVVSGPDASPLLRDGAGICHNIVSAYLSLLCHAAKERGINVRVVSTQLMIFFARNYGDWQNAAKYLKRTRVCAPSWTEVVGAQTLDLVFIPFFLGPNQSGYWTAMVLCVQEKEVSLTK